MSKSTISAITDDSGKSLKLPETPETPENPENPEIGLQAKLHAVYAGPASRSMRAAPTGGSAHPWRAWYWLLLKLVYYVARSLC